MKRAPKPPKSSQHTNAQHLQELSHQLVNAGSQLEAGWWKDQLSAELVTMLKDDLEPEIIDALESLALNNDAIAQDALAGCIEEVAETKHFDIEGTPHTALMIAIPILMWSRYNLPTGNISNFLLSTLKTQFGAHMLSINAQFTLANFLFSPDQLPRSFKETQELLETFIQAWQANTHLSVAGGSLPETGRFLADIRYLLGVVIVAKGDPVFRWQESDGDIVSAQQAWQSRGLRNLEPLFAGCAFEGLSANAYHTACRDADLAARPYALSAAISFLQAVTDLTPLDLQATVVSCFDRDNQEFRIGIGPANSKQIYQGTVWQVMELPSGQNDLDTLNDIEATLRSCGVLNINTLAGQFPAEYCDDCNVPLYPNPDGEMVHTEMPEGVENTNLTLH